MSASHFDFERLIQPFSPSIFFSEYWEQRPLFIARQLPNYYSSLFCLKDVDTLISFTSANDFYREDIRLANKKSHQPNQSTNFNETNLSQLYNLYSQGTTIILNALQKRWQPLAALCANLQSYFSCRVQANMYLTPKNSQGFKPHFDTHDVFILQIEGSKQWRIYDSIVSLPLADNQMQRELRQDEIGQPLHEICLQAGDFLYIPRGYVHEALTSDNSSLHLTVGIDVLRWAELIFHVLKSVTEQNVSFRKSLPVGFLTDSDRSASLGNQLAEMLQLLANSAKVSDGVEKLAEILFQQYPPMPDGHFTQLNALSSIELDTVVVKRQGMLCRVTDEQDQISILFPGNQVRGPKYIEPALKFIASSQEPFSVRSLPGSLSENAKLVLVRRLIREGLLMIGVKAKVEENGSSKNVALAQMATKLNQYPL